MFDKEFIDHIINYINDYPDDIRLDSYRDETCVNLTGRTGGRSDGWNRDRNSFTLQFFYDTNGQLKSINGVVPTFDTTELMESIKKAIMRNFKTRRKLDKLAVKGKRK